MATSKLTVALEDSQLQQLREIVSAGRAARVSAFVRHAVNIALSDAKTWDEMLVEALEQTGGPLSDAERSWADSILMPETATAIGSDKTA